MPEYDVYMEYEMGGKTFQQTVHVDDAPNSEAAYGQAVHQIADSNFGERPIVQDSNVWVDDR